MSGSLNMTILTGVVDWYLLCMLAYKQQLVALLWWRSVAFDRHCDTVFVSLVSFLWSPEVKLCSKRHSRMVAYEGHALCCVQMKEEMRRCEHLKRQTVGREVYKARTELTEFWDKCYVSQEQRATFLPFYDGSFCSFFDVRTKLHILKCW